uniref:EF-hand domain-containing protein n=1 Tax=Steinernema glaseri TaxID=37863 RepID=A0A1I7YZJ8_9BILA
MVVQSVTQVPLAELQKKYKDVNPFLIKKWERIFTLFFDRNCSHQVDWGDFYLVVREVRNIYGAESEQSSYAKKTMEALFEGLCKIADKDNDQLISIFEWIDLLKKVSANVKKSEPKWFIEYLTFLFKLFDVSADGVLDLAEYTDGMSTYGHSINDSHAAFKRFAVDPKGNSIRAIDLKQWHTYFHQLFFSTDPKDLGNNLFGTMN